MATISDTIQDLIKDNIPIPKSREIVKDIVKQALEEQEMSLEKAQSDMKTGIEDLKQKSDQTNESLKRIESLLEKLVESR